MIILPCVCCHYSLLRTAPGLIGYELQLFKVTNKVRKEKIKQLIQGQSQFTSFSISKVIDYRYLYWLHM